MRQRLLAGIREAREESRESVRTELFRPECIIRFQQQLSEVSELELTSKNSTIFLSRYERPGLRWSTLADR